MSSKVFTFGTSFVKILFIITVCYNYIECSDEDLVSVRLSTGVINGKIEASVDNKRINVFKGIPFAEPPIGDLRFKKPQPLKEWPNTLDAFEWPNPCYQTALPQSYGQYYNQNVSEDCLYLNIWSPENALKSDKLLPVVFYIHGGAFVMGTGSWSSYDMRAISTKGDVVSVSINYRLSTFGFLYTGTEEAPGNVGLLDQTLALEWVNDNIEYFGGDPKQITIMGMSAGGMSVSLHILSPISRNLFQNAILQSGAYVDHLVDGEYENPIKMWLKGSEVIGCNPNKVTEKFTTEIIECLQNADSKLLAGIPTSDEVKATSIHTLSLIAIDGHFLPKKPTEMLRSGDFKTDVNMLFSTAVDEGSMFLVLKELSAIPNSAKFITNNFTFEEAYSELKEISSKLSNKFAINGEDVAKVYFNGLSGSTDSDLLKRTIGIAVGDSFLGCPPILFSKEVFRNSHFKSNVYQYYWNRKVKMLNSLFMKVDWWGPQHGGDTAPTHGLPLIHPDKFPDTERQHSEQMIKFFTEFIRTGKPGSINGTEWPKYFNIDDHIIAPFYEITSSAKRDTNFGIGLKVNECEYLWQKYLM